jgi:hypothetical protein
VILRHQARFASLSLRTGNVQSGRMKWQV